MLSVGHYVRREMNALYVFVTTELDGGERHSHREGRGVGNVEGRDSLGAVDVSEARTDTLEGRSVHLHSLFDD